MALSLKKLKDRAITFVVAGGGLFALIWFPPKWVFHLFLLMVGILGVGEIEKIAKGHGLACFRLPIYFSLAYGLGSIYLPFLDLAWLPYGAVLLAALISIGGTSDVRQKMPQFGLTLVACAYLGFSIVTLGYLFQMGTPDQDQLGRYLFLIFLGTVWAGDSFAYLGGSVFGKHKISPVLSPNKSWEGMIANLIGNAAALTLAGHFFLPQMEWIDILILTLIFGFLGFFGDLVESSWKRGSAIKDSSTLFPGHGGVLDRIDSIFLTAPLFLIYMQKLVLAT